MKKYLATTSSFPHGYWGKADTVQEAVKNLRNQDPEFVKDNGYLVYEVDPAAYVDRDGLIMYPNKDDPPKIVVDKRIKRKERGA